MNKRFLWAMMVVLWMIPVRIACGQEFLKSEIYDQLKDLGRRLYLHAYEIDSLTATLHSATFEPTFARLLDENPIRAVFVFSAAEGGVIFKYMRGDGFISFAGGRHRAPISIEGRSLGAMLGGSHMLGVGLVMGSISDSGVGGTYEGSVGGATFATESTPTGAAFWKIGGFSGENRPLIYMVHTGRGVSFGAGNAWLTLTPGW